VVLQVIEYSSEQVIKN